MSIESVLRVREALHQQVIDSLESCSKDTALSVVMSWLSLDDLRGMIPTVCGEEPRA